MPLIAFSNCVENVSKDSNSRYDIEVLYNYYELDSADLRENRWPPDSLPLYFEYSFDNDYVEVFVNGEIFFEDTLVSDEIAVSAKLLEIGEFKEIDNIGIRINN